MIVGFPVAGMTMTLAEMISRRARQPGSQLRRVLIWGAYLLKYGIVKASFLLLLNRFVCGTIVRKKIVTFERVLWRSLRGNLYMNHSEMTESVADPSTVCCINT